MQAQTTTNPAESAHSRLLARLKRLRGPIVAIAAGGLLAAALFARLGRRARGLGVPFGPFLAGGGAVALWAGPPMLSWYAERIG